MPAGTIRCLRQCPCGKADGQIRRTFLVDVFRDRRGPAIPEKSLHRRYDGRISHGAVRIDDTVHPLPYAGTDHQFKHIKAEMVFLQDLQLHIVWIRPAQTACFVVDHRFVVFFAQCLHDLTNIPHPLPGLKIVMVDQNIYQFRSLAGFDLIGVCIAHSQSVYRIFFPHMGNGMTDEPPHQLLLGAKSLHILRLGRQLFAEIGLLRIERDKVGGMIPGLVGNVPEQQAGLLAHGFVNVVKIFVRQRIVFRFQHADDSGQAVLGSFLHKVRIEGSTAVNDGRGGYPMGPSCLNEVFQILLEGGFIPQIGLIGQKHSGAV